MSIESMIPSNHLILCRPLLLLPSIFPSIRVFSNELALHIRWPKYWCFNFSISASNDYLELISFSIDWFDLLAVQESNSALLHCRQIHPKGDQSWVFTGRTDAEAETPVLWPPHEKSWLIGKYSEGLGAGGEGDDRGWDGWMVSPTWCTWLWVNSGSWWWTGRPGCNCMCCNLWGHEESGTTGMTELNWRISSYIYLQQGQFQYKLNAKKG